MIVQDAYQAHGKRTPTVFGRGVLLLFRLGPADELDQSGPLVGIWSNVTYLEARNPTHELIAGAQRQSMEARNAHLESH